MNPTELHSLFSTKEQTLLVATEAARLKGLSEDELDQLLGLVRRERNKYSTLYRRQSSALVEASSSRAGTATSNQRTRRKAEIFEDALARVAGALSKAARASANELKAQRLEAARAAKAGGSKGTAGKGGAAGTGGGAKGGGAKGAAVKDGGSKGGRSNGAAATGAAGATGLNTRGRVAKSATASPARRGSSTAQGALRQARSDSR